MPTPRQLRSQAAQKRASANDKASASLSDVVAIIEPHEYEHVFDKCEMYEDEPAIFIKLINVRNIFGYFEEGR